MEHWMMLGSRWRKVRKKNSVQNLCVLSHWGWQDLEKLHLYRLYLNGNNYRIPGQFGLRNAALKFNVQ